MGQWRNISTILDLCTRWKCVVSFTPRQIYYQGKSHRNPLYRRLGWHQRRENCLALTGHYYEAKCGISGACAPMWRVGCWNALPSPGVLGSRLSFSISQAILNPLEVSNPLFWCAPSESFIEFLKKAHTKFRLFVPLPQSPSPYDGMLFRIFPPYKLNCNLKIFLTRFVFHCLLLAALIC